MRPRLLTLVLLLVVVLRADPASALWSTTAAGPAAASAGTLGPPTAVTVTWDPVVHVSWTASASTWASGYRLHRGVSPTGPFTQVAEVPALTTTVDDSPGAGTYYYVVLAYRGLWLSQVSNVVARADPTYVFKSSTAFTAAPCADAANGKYDMQQGWSTTGGTELSKRRQEGGFNFCTSTFTAGQTLAAGMTTLNGYVSNTNGASCDIYLTLSVNGSTVLGSGTLRVQQSAAKKAQAVSFSTAGYTFATGDRIQLSLSWQTVNACNDSKFYWNSTGSPSGLTLTG